MITDHKLLVAIFKKDIVRLSQRLQRILLHIHQYSIRILYKCRPQLFIADWLSRPSHKTNRDEGITEMHITINDIDSDIPDYITAQEIRSATIDDEYLSIL